MKTKRADVAEVTYSLVPMDRFDQHVMPQLLHQMSCQADPIFKEHLMVRRCRFNPCNPG